MEINQKQVELMIESLEELNEELSNQNKGTLFAEQWDLLDYLKSNKSNVVLGGFVEKYFSTFQKGSPYYDLITCKGVKPVPKFLVHKETKKNAPAEILLNAYKIEDMGNGEFKVIPSRELLEKYPHLVNGYELAKKHSSTLPLRVHNPQK